MRFQASRFQGPIYWGQVGGDSENDNENDNDNDNVNENENEMGSRVQE
jgi:hypothetical protein